MKGRRVGTVSRLQLGIESIPSVDAVKLVWGAVERRRTKFEFAKGNADGGVENLFIDSLIAVVGVVDEMGVDVVVLMSPSLPSNFPSTERALRMKIKKVGSVGLRPCADVRCVGRKSRGPIVFSHSGHITKALAAINWTAMLIG